MLMKKYGAILLFLVLEYVYCIITDVTVGLPWNTIIINWNFTLFTGMERFIAISLVLLMIISDLRHLILPNKSNPRSRSNSIDHRSNDEN